MSTRRAFPAVLWTIALLSATVSPAAADFLLVSSVGTNSILEYNTAGSLQKTVVTASNIDAPYQMAFAPGDTTHLYVAILGSSQVYVFNQTTNAFTPFVTGGVNFNGQPAYPGYITFDTDPTDNTLYLYVNDFKHNQILRYFGPGTATPGAAAPSLGQTGAVYVPANLTNGVLNAPTGIQWADLPGKHALLAINSSGSTNDQIMQFTESNTHAVSGGGNFIGQTPALVNGASMHVRNGQLWVTSFGNNSIVEYDLNNGHITHTYTNANLNLGTGAKLNQPAGFAFDTAGNLFIANSGDNDVVELNVATNTLSVVVPTNGGLGGATLLPIDIQYISGISPFDVTTPEPSSFVLLGMGLIGTAAYRLRKRA